MIRPLNAIALATLVASSAPGAAAQTPVATDNPPGFRVLETTIGDVQAAFKSGQLTCRALVGLYLKRIEAYDKQGPNLNAAQNVNPRALAEADNLDAAFKASGPVGPLHCIPILLKDEIETSDMPTTYGSAVFKDFVPQRDATIVTKLKEAGALIVAKTNMGEFANGYVGSAFGVSRNPYDPRRNPSGSSAGTGAGVAANYAIVGIGEDTGGSIRGPASVASLVGLRPSVPLVSRFGMMPANPTQDTLGPITRTVRDAAILLDAIAGYDPNDRITAYSVGQVAPTYTAFLRADGLQGARLGIIREPMDPKTDPSSDDYKKVRTVIDKAIADLERLGAEIVDPVTIPDLKDRVKRMYIDNVFETEQATNAYLAEHKNAPAKTLREILLSGKVVPWRAKTLLDNIGRSTDQLGYLQVLAVREETRQLILGIMADYRLDALVYATFDHQPALIAPDVLTNPDTKDEYRLGTNRNLSPSLGFPALTVPAGFTTDGLPVGIEFMARMFAEPTLFRLGYAYEQATHNRKPPASTPALPGDP
jgi:amidase